MIDIIVKYIRTGLVETMSDLLLFLKNGWVTVWKQNIVWFFSTVFVVCDLLRAFQTRPPVGSPWMLLYLLESCAFMVLTYICAVGVSYIVYCSVVGKVSTVQDVLFVSKKFFWRYLGCYILFLLVYLLVFFFISLFSLVVTKPTVQSPSNTYLILFLLSIFSSLIYFSGFGFFANDWSVWQTIKNAWGLLNDHFGVLAILGVLLTLAVRIWDIFAGVSTVLIQSGLDTALLSKLNYWSLSTSLGRNILFMGMSGLGQIILTPLNAAVFMNAYTKYKGENSVS